MLRKTDIPAILVLILLPNAAFGVDWVYTPLGALSTEITGGFGAVANPSDGSVYNDGANYSYPVILDSGSSGFLMSRTVTDDFGVPLQSGQTYLETGLGGSESENVTQPLIAYYSPPSNSNPDNIATMTAYGTFTFESRQSDPLEGAIYFDVIGTPIIQTKVMVVTPNQSYNLVQDTLGFLTAQTTLQATRPTLGAGQQFHVPITWTNFVTGTPVPSEGPNPMVNGVRARGPNGVPSVNNWLFDTGAQFTIVDATFAASLGVDLNNPITTVEGQGVGGSTVDFDEFQIAEIALPLANGDRLVFSNPYIFVPENQSLPSGLVGILGENLFMQSADSIDPFTGQPVGSHGALFSEWYLDGPGSELVLFDPNAVPPQPTWSGTTNNNWTILAADLNWTGSPWTNNANRSTPNVAMFNAGTPGTITVNSNIDVGSVTFTTGGWTLGAGTGVLAYGATGAITITTTTGTDTINASIVDGSTFGSGGGITALIKAGDGVLVLARGNSYTGGTSVNGGTLLVNNFSGSATGSGAVTLNAGTLAGHGIISGAVVAGSGAHTIAPSGTLPSGSFATLTVGALTTNANTTLAFSLLVPGASSVSDRIVITGASALNLSGGGKIQITGNDTGVESLGWYKAIQFAGSLSAPTAANLGLTMPGVVNNVAYVLDATHDGGFIDIHRGFLGDANDDGTVNFDDFLVLSQHFGQAGGWNQANFLGDATVDFNDFLVLSQHFGQSINGQSVVVTAAELAAMKAFGAGADPVPEPAGLAIFGAGALAFLRRRRRRGT